MGKCKPVEITEGSFAFCRYTLAGTLWLSVIFRNIEILAFVVIILILSVILKAEKAPFIWLYRNTVDRLKPSKKIYVNEYAIRFAHGVGAVFGGIGLGIISFINPLAGWIFIGILAILKTSGAMGYCGAMKLYDCLYNSDGQCCRFGNKVKNAVNK